MAGLEELEHLMIGNTSSTPAATLGDRERTQVQEGRELYIDPRVPISEIVELLCDLGLTLGKDAHLEEAYTVFGTGFVLSTNDGGGARG